MLLQPSFPSRLVPEPPAEIATPSLTRELLGDSVETEVLS
jgi:hypothetical protein